MAEQNNRNGCRRYTPCGKPDQFQIFPVFKRIREHNTIWDTRRKGCFKRYGRDGITDNGNDLLPWEDNSERMIDKFELISKVIGLLDNIHVSGVKDVLSLAEVFQMLNTLQKGLKDEDNARNQVIESLKKQLKRATEPQPEDGGDIVGGEHYKFHFGGDSESGN